MKEQHDYEQLLSCRFFAETEAVCSWKRDLETLKGVQTKECLNRWPLVWLEKSFDPEDICGEGSLIKVCPFPPPPPPLFLCLFLGETTKAASPPLRDPSFLCSELGPVLTHWLFYLMWNSKLNAEPRQILPQQNDQTPPPLQPLLFLSLHLSFACRRKQPQLHWFSFLFYWITSWGSKSGLIQVMAFHPYRNENDCRYRGKKYLIWVTKTVSWAVVVCLHDIFEDLDMFETFRDPWLIPPNSERLVLMTCV